MANHYPSVAMISRLPLHGLPLSELLSKHYSVVWIGKNYPKLGIGNASYILLKELYNLLVTYKKRNYSVVILQYISLDGIAALLMKRLFKLPFVLFAIGSDVMCAEQNSVNFIVTKTIANQSDQIFCVNTKIKEKLITFGCVPSKIQVIPSILSMEQSCKFHPKEHSVISVGSIDDNKNHRLLIEACKLLPQLSVLIVGDGPLREELQHEVSLNSLRVSFSGQISHRQVFSELEKSKIYVHCSKREGLPTVVLEAMLCGLPVILVESDYTQELTQRYKLSVHIAANSSARDLADNIQLVLANYSSELQTANNNRKSVISFLDKTERTITNTLDNLLVSRQ